MAKELAKLLCRSGWGSATSSLASVFVLKPDFYFLYTLCFLLSYFGRRCWPVGCGSLSEVTGDLCWMNKAYPLPVQPDNNTEGMGHPVTVLLLIFQTAGDEWQCHPRTHHPAGIAMRLTATSQQVVFRSHWVHPKGEEWV